MSLDSTEIKQKFLIFSELKSTNLDLVETSSHQNICSPIAWWKRKLSRIFSLHALTAAVVFPYHPPVHAQVYTFESCKYIISAPLVRVLLKAFIYYISNGSLRCCSHEKQFRIRWYIKNSLSQPLNAKVEEAHVMESDTCVLFAKHGEKNAENFFPFRIWIPNVEKDWNVCEGFPCRLLEMDLQINYVKWNI